jgi:phosphohistidine phosphatase
MKRLIMVRHAKSSWNYPDLKDFYRPLNDRGFQDAVNMADYINNKGMDIGLFISSPAVRALTTANLFAKTMRYPIDKIEQEPSFYEFFDDGDIMLSKVRTLDNRLSAVAIFGHNDTLLNLVENLSHGQITKFPTCAAACVVFPINSWSEIKTKNGQVEFFMTPKSL